MKRHGELWPQIISMENLSLAYEKAKSGKSHYFDVQMIETDPDKYLKKLQRNLAKGRFNTSSYVKMEKQEGGKLREIHKLPFYPDRIVQHALMNVVGPILRNSMIRDTFQSFKGRGTSDCRRRIQKLTKSDHCPQYSAKVDISKFYQSVNNDLMKQKLRTKIKCQDTLILIDNILDSIHGLPIGNLTSQDFGNFYLNELDWTVKQSLKPAGYYRYCDDIVIFSNSKKELKAVISFIKKHCQSIKVSIKPNWEIVDIYKQGIDFVGYVFSSTQTKIRKSIVNKVVTTIDKPIHVDTLRSLISYKGWFKHSNAHSLWTELIPESYHQKFDGFFNENPLRAYP